MGESSDDGCHAAEVARRDGRKFYSTWGVESVRPEKWGIRVGMSSEKILVAESQLLCRSGLATLLRSECGFASVEEVADCPSLLSRIGRDSAVRMITLDPDLPGLGAGGLRDLRLRYPGIRIAVVASVRDRNAVLNVLAAGAHGYVPKDLPVQEMIRAFQMIAEGRIYVPSVVTDLAPAAVAAPSAGAYTPALLTDRQQDVLSLLITGKSNKEIARALRIAESTVKVHMTAAFRLLGVRNRVGAVAALQSCSIRYSGTEPLLPGLMREGRRASDRADPFEGRIDKRLPLSTRG